MKVTGWQTPVSSLFYRATSRRCSYLAPDGGIHGEVRLKRRLTVDRGELFHIADDLLDAAPDDGAIVLERQGELPVMAAPRDPLLATLSGRASPWLRDIITTIQPEQYALIAAPADQVLVVQGVAGSGKTSIALHRLSFLIYPSLVAGTIPPRCIIFGPNRLFLKYISAVLPKLGLQRVVQTTVTERHLERLRLKNVRLTDVTFDALLDPSTPAEERKRLYQRSRLKTSRRMGALLERYVAWRRTRITIPVEGWSFQQTIQLRLGSKRLEHHISAEEIRKRHAMHLDRPFEVHRALFTESLWAYVNERLEARGETAREEAKEKLALGRRRLQQAAEQRSEVMRLKSAREARPVAFGAAPVFGASPPPRGRPMLPVDRLPRPSGSAGGNTGGELLHQTTRQLELSAERRQQEGEEIVREAEAMQAALLTPDELTLARRGLRVEVERLVQTHWPGMNVVREYGELMGEERQGSNVKGQGEKDEGRKTEDERWPATRGVAERSLLRELAGGIFDDLEVEQLQGVVRTRGSVVDLSDLPAIHYLFVISQDPEVVGRTVHEHVVIDEAQDVAELDLYCLRRLERRQRFTLLGDLSQSIYGHRGLTSWAQAEAIFSGVPYAFEACTVSYRTTAEITQLANRVLRSLDRLTRPHDDTRGGAGGAQPFARHGREPALVQVPDEQRMVDAIGQAIGEARARGMESVAVITKTPERAQMLAEALSVVGTADLRLIDSPEFEYRGGVVVMPVHLAKGLEFDASIVVDVDAKTYSPVPFDGRLLYVALTRALHEVHVLWQGEVSGHLGTSSE